MIESTLPPMVPAANAIATDAPKRRVEWLDTFKGIAIILVVVGHVLGGLIASKLLVGPGADYAYRWIYAFHMAAFFFASGVVTVRCDPKPLGAFFIDRLQTIAWPYLVWSVVFIGLRWFMDGWVNSPGATVHLWDVIYRPVGVLWFLYVLFMMQMLAGTAATLRLGRWAMPLVALAMFVFREGTQPQWWAVLDGLAKYLPFFAAGIWFRDIVVDADVRRLPSLLLFVAALVGFGVMSAGVALGINDARWVWIGCSVLGIAGLSAAAMLLERVQMASPFRRCGTLSMGIFLLHPFTTVPVRIVLVRYLHVDSGLVHLVLETAVGVVASAGIYALCMQNGLWFLFCLRRPRGRSGS